MVRQLEKLEDVLNVRRHGAEHAFQRLEGFFHSTPALRRRLAGDGTRARLASRPRFVIADQAGNPCPATPSARSSPSPPSGRIPRPGDRLHRVHGCPPGLALCEADIQAELDRRKPGTSRHVTQRREPDTVEILSGVFEGITTGTPISLLIRNQDQRSKDYGNIADLPPRPRRLRLPGRNTACAITVAAGALRRARPLFAWPRARSRRSG